MLAQLSLSLYQCSFTQKPIRYPGRDSRNTGFSPIVRRNLRDSLKARGLIKVSLGDWQKGRETTIRPTSALLPYFQDIAPDTINTARPPVVIDDTACNAPEAESIRHQVDNINVALSNHIATWQGLKLSTTLFRSFSGDLRHGGRFYASTLTDFQCMSKNRRKRIQLDESETVELDFDSLHPVLIYNRISERMPETPYIFDKSDRARKLIKRSLMALLNAHDINKAKGAIYEKLAEYNLFRRFPTPSSVVGILSDRHPALVPFFGSGVGLELQKTDSDITARILSDMVVKHGIPCLPVHDSYIAPKLHGQILKSTMEKAFFQHLENPKNHPKISES